MHIVTFYSFKGGSGRSMALVNVAAELAKSGQRVLIVDFDLEAPGLDTFRLPRPDVPTRGLVDFIHEYLESGQSPDAREFLYESRIPEISGKLWVMPAGKNDESYDRRFKAINWRDLYENHDGYLLLEDLRAQWAGLNPDYVLIDSRTGHTDMSGICTRQLPDAVFLFIFPTEQNRRGLKSVVEKIRGEKTTEGEKEIKLHLVFANVPDLDDEERYIADSIVNAQQSLKFDSPSAVIHHYSSPILLTQPVFTLDRPRTKLAHEYQELTKAVRSDNLKDRTVALEFLEQSMRRPDARPSEAEKLETRLQDIEKEHNKDPEILTNLARIYRRLRRMDTALALLEQAGRRNASGSNFFLERVSLYIAKDKLDEALTDLRNVLKSDDATYIEMSAATRTLLYRFPDYLSELLEAPAFTRLADENKFWLTNDLLQKSEGIEPAYEVLRKLIVKNNLPSVLKGAVLIQFVLACIAGGKFQEALKTLTADKPQTAFGLVELFNYTIARWGVDGEPNADLFARIIELEANVVGTTANVHQCLSLAFWAVGNLSEAYERSRKAQEVISTQAQPEFSCWSYLFLSRDDFLRDLAEMRALFNNEDIQPRFIGRNRDASREQLIG